MSKREWKLYLEDILESMSLVKQYVENMDIDDFRKDRKTTDAVIRNLEIIGEAAKFIPDDIKIKYQEVDWKGIIGFRNRATHVYFTISLDVVWHIIKNELPVLNYQMRRILEENG